MVAAVFSFMVYSMPREKSLSAYEEIKSKNLLSKRRFQVYEIMVENDPLTLTPNEIWEEMKQRDPINSRLNIHARLKELKQLGVIEEASYRLCSQTNIKAVTHTVTGALPSGRVKKSATKADLEKRIAELEEENDQLRSWLMQPKPAIRLVKSGEQK